MTTSNQGVGRTLPAGGTTDQVPVIDTTAGADLAFKDNGARKVRVITASTATAAYGDVILADTTSNTVSLTLPTLDGTATHAFITAKRETGSSNAFTVLGTINGSTNLVVTTVVTLVNNGTAWRTL